MTISTTLSKRNGYYYFRKRVPADLQCYFNKKEIIKSLKTNQLSTALLLCSKMLSSHNNHMQRLRESKSMSNENPYWIVESAEEDEDDLDLDLENDTNGLRSELQIIVTTTAQDGTKTEMTIDHAGDIEAERETAQQLLQVHKFNQALVQQPIIATATKYTLKHLVDKYLESKKQSGAINAKSLETYSNSLELLVEFFGTDTDVKSIKLEKAETFRNILMKLPANRKKTKALKGLSLQDTVKKELTPQSATTVKGCVERCSTFFDWAVKADYADKNYFHKMTVPTKRKKESENRERWATTDLHKLFAHKIYTAHDFDKVFQYWLPLLGLYTGGRLNEIAQASVKDIKKIDGIWCISITDEAEHQKLKNANSARIIPIHQHLIDLGFIEYVQSRASKTLLFDDLLNSKAEVPRDGLGSNVGKWFNQFIKRLEIHNAVFHSFRHTVARLAHFNP